MSDKEPAIIVKDIYKSFKLPHEQHSGLKQLVVNFAKHKRGYETQRVLKDVSFEIKKGEFFGIVGRNGSGKSTLLKLLAGIYTPDKGAIQVNGSLTPFIELGVGFNPELTGRENVFMNGALLGMSHKEVEKIYDAIVEFAEIERFMDQKLKNYSSGMQVRLAFSIAIRAQSDVLLFDEVLAVGDASFQQKCYEMFDTLKEEGRTIVLVTHDMSAVQRFCEKAVLIDGGRIVLSGDPGEIADRYLEQNFEKNPNESKLDEDPAITLSDVSITSNGKVAKSLSINEPISVDFTLHKTSENKLIHLGLQIFNNAGAYCFGMNTLISSQAAVGQEKVKVEVLLKQNLVPGTYYITLAVMDKNASKVLKYLPKIATFNVKQQSKIQGVAFMDYEWRFKDV